MEGLDNMRYKQVKIQRKYRGYFAIDLVTVEYEKFNGELSRPHTLEIFERGKAAAVIPYDPERDEVVWIEQFRTGAMRAGLFPWMIETVAGIIEDGETAKEVVRREAVEEAGGIITELEIIGEYLVSPGGTSELITLFCGKTDTSSLGGLYGLEHENEDIKARVVSFNDSVAMYKDGKLKSATPLIAVQWLMLNHDRIRAKWR